MNFHIVSLEKIGITRGTFKLTPCFVSSCLIWVQVIFYEIDALFLRLQVNFCQKLLFLQQLTHNMTTDSSLNYEFGKRIVQAQNMLCTRFFVFDLTFRTIYVHMF
mgnify:CR=1 FL=1